MVRHDLHEDNRIAWNAATDAHNSHKQDQAAFFRAGGTTLFPEEVGLLGDLTGKALLHLQCNAGQDTLSLARSGARATGVDVSDTAIAFARQLSADSAIPATFHRADVYAWLAAATEAEERYDIVFSSYGAIIWLTDLALWAHGIAGVLAPGGRCVLVEFHPVAHTFDWDWTHRFPYFTGGQAESYDSGVGDYVALSGAPLAPSGYLPGVENFQNPYRGHEVRWTLAEVVSALLDAGLQVTALHEYPYANGARLFDRMQELPGGRMVPPPAVPNLPLMYALAARKPA